MTIAERFIRRALIFCSLTVLTLAFTGVAFGQAGSSTATRRITQNIDETKLVSLTGSTHRLANANSDQGAVSDSMPMEHLFLQLQRGPEAEKALEKLMREQQDPTSANYHKWLSAEELGRNYGPATEDIEKVTSWLGSHGFQVNKVFENGMTIDVSGTAGQVHSAFHTQIHEYSVNGEKHIANANDPQIPAALATVVTGFASLNNFMPKPLVRKTKSAFSFPCTGCPEGFDGQEQYDIAPPDFATIYNVTPLYKRATPITGKGQTVVVLEVSDIKPADVATFRAAFGLSGYAGTFTQIHPGTGCTDPGKNGAEVEAAIDAEWAGAIAPDAAVELASCASTTNFGAAIAAQNLLEKKNPPPIMSLSFLGCETDQGPGGNASINALWQQAASEGVSVFVAAGDGGPDSCDNFNTSPYAISGITVNGLASTPYNVATGGTDFLDFAENTISTYWSNTNSATGKSAKSYIPETPWNDSCGSIVLAELFGDPSPLDFCNTTGQGFLDIVGGSGGPSFVYAKPFWQKGIAGNPSDGKRDLPDISLFASSGFYSHALLFCMSDASEGGTTCDYSTPLDAFSNSAGGTSFTAPQFASIQALINQKAGGPQGNPAPLYYDLARNDYGRVFHDVTVGNNNVPCYGTNNCFLPAGDSYGLLSTSDSKLKVAYPAQSGWDFATGLGSVNVTQLVSLWP